jgi:RNA polymerase sigma-70 factor (ECF subfamily)
MDRGEERALIAQVLTGDRRAARALYDAHVHRTYRLAFRLTKDSTAAEEVTQDTFVKVFERLDTFRQESQLSTWIYRVTVSLALNRLRSERRLARREVGLEDAAEHAVQGSEVEPDLRERLGAAIAALPELYRVPVLLFDVEGMSHAEMAEVLGVPEGTCKSRLARARAQLREALTAFAPGAEEGR